MILRLWVVGHVAQGAREPAVAGSGSSERIGSTRKPAEIQPRPTNEQIKDDGAVDKNISPVSQCPEQCCPLNQQYSSHSAITALSYVPSRFKYTKDATVSAAAEYFDNLCLHTFSRIPSLARAARAAVREACSHAKTVCLLLQIFVPHVQFGFQGARQMASARRDNTHFVAHLLSIASY